AGFNTYSSAPLPCVPTPWRQPSTASPPFTTNNHAKFCLVKTPPQSNESSTNHYENLNIGAAGNGTVCAERQPGGLAGGLCYAVAYPITHPESNSRYHLERRFVLTTAESGAHTPRLPRRMPSTQSAIAHFSWCSRAHQPD